VVLVIIINTVGGRANRQLRTSHWNNNATEYMGLLGCEVSLLRVHAGYSTAFWVHACDQCKIMN